ncbi:3-hydroxybutyryl-CoA dehydrogenase [Paenibacillus alkaliterrae]|uniref:3-hydroxybutyryl-CoA dehydrogenase n=1 Tax=Paenibacillus alkaliterrae TaxID=320909 RepID=UPI001F3D5B56|nr:3-hydroxybutyryl-CoA dehydrogenase [Paenibacillus alkaliterrae]MCF2940151.1 3-hydroxybutyryl-CoA dehydrogenase [Paenibacillus alkaliterrae]
MVIRAITVAGAGQMGSGIAQVFAHSGFNVTLYDIEQEAVNRGFSAIESSLSRFVHKGRIREDQKFATLSNLTLSTDLGHACNSDLVIEAAPEKIETKKILFKSLDRICKEHALLTSNTSSLSITEIAAATARPENVIGMHFMNPVPIMPLVEIIRGLATSDDTYDHILSLTQALGKTAVTVKDFPGFVSNRLLMPMINEAIYAVYEGVATPAAVDQVMTLGMNHPMGPLALADLIGLDTCLSIMETLHDGFGDSKYRPCPLLRSYVQAGWLGRKAGRGFYLYSERG